MVFVTLSESTMLSQLIIMFLMMLTFAECSWLKTFGLDKYNWTFEFKLYRQTGLTEPPEPYTHRYFPPFEDTYECPLVDYSYFPFVVRVATGYFGYREPGPIRTGHYFNPDELISTGSIITPNTVLTVCTPFESDDYVYKKIWVMAKNNPTEDFDDLKPRKYFYTNQRAFDKPLTLGQKAFIKAEVPHGNFCFQIRNVTKIYRHVKCDYKRSHPQTERYNFIVFRIQRPFWAYPINMNISLWDRDLMAHMPIVPTLPLTLHLEENIELVDLFNSKRHVRCHLPRWSKKDKFADGNEKSSYIRSIPMHRECAKILCLTNYENSPLTYTYIYHQALCMKDLFSMNGTLVCAALLQADGNNYYWEPDKEPLDYFSHWSEDKGMTYSKTPGYYPCRDKSFILGTPVFCRGALLGFVTGCYDYFYVIATMVPAWNFLLRFVTNPKRPEIFMDQRKAPVSNKVPPFWGPDDLPFNEIYQRVFHERR